MEKSLENASYTLLSISPLFLFDYVVHSTVILSCFVAVATREVVFVSVEKILFALIRAWIPTYDLLVCRFARFITGL